MNYWGLQQLPYRYPFRDTKSKWSYFDDLVNFAKNRNAADWLNIEIQYEFNSHGFRTHDLNGLLGQSVDVALGCSFTAGVGLPASMTWPTLIEQQRSQPMLNLGVAGGSTDTVARILTNISGLYQIKSVFILWPFAERFELYGNDSIKNTLPTNARDMHLWNMDEDTSEQRYRKNKNIVDMLSQIHKFSVSEYSVAEVFDNAVQMDSARDGAHPGPKTNIRLADILLGNLTQ
jgi:hypothetical protein